MAAVQISQLYKRFALHKDQPRSLQELVVGFFKGESRRREPPFWALQDISLDVLPGETLALIGENGSGKSTLLKLIARILEPTEGTIDINGRVAALLELGAGFHPDLTGRENIYLNGSILGLTRREMAARYEDIVSFAEMERFIDVPLKHYSSGMQVRLGFAIATSIDPDILLIDEVLAVGDESFQHKCLDRIDEFRARDKTIIFVSHDLGTVNELCDRAVWLEQGQIRDMGLTRRVIDEYLTSVGEKESQQLAAQHEREVATMQTATPALSQVAGPPPADVEPKPSGADLVAAEPLSASEVTEPTHWGTGAIEITDVRLIGEQPDHKYLFYCGEPLTIEIDFQAHVAADDVVFGVGIYRHDELFCYGTNTDLEELSIAVEPGPGMVQLAFQRFAFMESTYSLDVAIHTAKGAAYDYYRRYYTFAVRSRWNDMGVFRPRHRWTVETASGTVRSEMDEQEFGDMYPHPSDLPPSSG